MFFKFRKISMLMNLIKIESLSPAKFVYLTRKDNSFPSRRENIKKDDKKVYLKRIIKNILYLYVFL